MTRLGKRLIKSAQEGRKIVRGEASPKTYKMPIPTEIDVKAVRNRLKLTQEEFSVRYGLTLARVRDWEQGRSMPDSAARAYLTVIEREPKAVARALAEAQA